MYERLRLGGKAGQAADVDYLVEIYRSYFFEWQENRPAVFDDSDGGDVEEGTAAVAVAGVGGEMKERTENGAAGGGDGAGAGGGEGQAVGGGEVKEEVVAGGERVEEVAALMEEKKEVDAEGDQEMRESESKVQNEAGEPSLEKEMQSSAVVSQDKDDEEGKSEQPTQPSELSKPAGTGEQTDAAST